MEIFDLGIAWNSEQDNEFVYELNTAALKYGLRPYLIHAYNFYSSLKDIAENKLFFRFFLDRTLRNAHAFKGLAPFLKKKGSIFINHPDNAKISEDKIRMHQDFLNHNIAVPETFFLDNNESYETWELKIKNIMPELFIFKSMNRAGANNENTKINCPEDILKLKKENSAGSYMIQKKVLPQMLQDNPAWFKTLYCLGEIFACWWHPVNHSYKILTAQEFDKFGLLEICKITAQIQNACKLSFFSAEIALQDNNKFVVANYAHDKPDMRRQSKFNDGLPDEIVNKIIEKCSLFAKTNG